MKIRMFGWAALACILMSGPVLADKGWSTVASLKAGGDARTVEVNRPISRVAVSCTGGEITVARVTVIDGDRKTPFNISSKLKKGESQQITVGDEINCNRLVIEVQGDGDYQVRVRR